jgi:HK97 family phage prohead protease
MPNKAFSFELKKLNDVGEFTGIASVYGVEDLGGDIVEAGAFTKTLATSGRERPLLWQHRDPVGLCTLTDTVTGLALSGKLSLGLQAAKDALTLLRDGVVQGLSIGFQTVREEFVGDVRHLKEVRLWEVSLVTFPMNEQAVITSVKARQQTAAMSRVLREFKSDVLNALER